MVIAFPWGVASAVYLHEYAKPGPVLRAIRLGINNLAGVPSVVFGLFGLAFFVTWCRFGVSVLSGALTLSALILPVIIGTAEEALRAVPATYREASLALEPQSGRPYTEWCCRRRFPRCSRGAFWESVARPGRRLRSCSRPRSSSRAIFRGRYLTP